MAYCYLHVEKVGRKAYVDDWCFEAAWWVRVVGAVFDFTQGSFIKATLPAKRKMRWLGTVHVPRLLEPKTSGYPNSILTKNPFQNAVQLHY